MMERIEIDVPTLLSYTTMLVGLLGGVFTYCWSREVRNVPLIWFALPFLFAATGTGITVNPALKAGEVGLRLGACLILLAYGFAWLAVRALYQRKRHVWAVLVPPLGWLALATVLDRGAWPLTTAGLRIGLIAAYSFLTSYEFWCSKFEDLPSRKILTWVFGTFAALNALRVPFLAVAPMPIGTAPTEVWSVALYNVVSVAVLVLGTTYMIILASERQAARNYDLALRDGLTGVYNRRAYYEAIRGPTFPASETNGGLALIVFDIDRFKSINDRFGHQTGDHVIILAAQAATALARQQDSIFRIGGEEFVCLLPDTKLDDALCVAENIRNLFQSLADNADGKPTCATISLGVAASSGGSTAEQLFVQADSALYMAKSQGRNQTVVLPGGTSLRPYVMA